MDKYDRVAERILYTITFYMGLVLGRLADGWEGVISTAIGWTIVTIFLIWYDLNKKSPH